MPGQHVLTASEIFENCITRGVIFFSMKCERQFYIRFIQYTPLMVFMTCYPKIWYLGILNILSWRGLRKQQEQEAYSDLPSPYFTLLPWEQEINFPCEMYPPCTRRKGSLYKQTLLKLTFIFPATSLPFTTPNPNPPVLSNSSQIYCFFV